MKVSGKNKTRQVTVNSFILSFLTFFLYFSQKKEKLNVDKKIVKK